MSLKIGYVGAGSFSNRAMFPQLNRHDVVLEAICDLDEARARTVAGKYGFRHVHTDVDQMCDQHDLDAVFCVGGPVVHHKVGLQILGRGLPLYIQKSPAPNSDLTKELVALADEKDVVCHVGFNIRSSAAASAARHIIETPEFGRPTLGIFRYGFVTGATTAEAVMDQHCHLYDTARFLMGDVESIHVLPGTLSGVRHYVATATFTSGAVATFNFTSEQSGKEFVYYEVTGERGHMITSHQFNLRYDRPAADGSGVRTEVLTQGLGMFGSPDPLEWAGYQGDVANFLAAVRGEADDVAPVASTVGTMELCEAVVDGLELQGHRP